jgi:hypothetical protein
MELGVVLENSFDFLRHFSTSNPKYITDYRLPPPHFLMIKISGLKEKPFVFTPAHHQLITLFLISQNRKLNKKKETKKKQ